MTASELFELQVSALSTLELDLSLARDKRVYLAYVAARIGQGANGDLERRLAELRKELSL